MARKGPSESGIGMAAGKDLEIGLLGRPQSFDEGLEIPADFKPRDVVPLVRKNEKRLVKMVRENQSGNPRAPKKPFLKRLARDIDKALMQSEFPEEYEVRIYSAVGTSLDAAGIDFWVELYDSDKENTVSNYRIDLKSNPHGRKGPLADHLYFLDYDVASSDDREAIYSQPEYVDLVDSTVARFERAIESSVVRSSRIGIRRSLIEENEL